MASRRPAILKKPKPTDDEQPTDQTTTDEPTATDEPTTEPTAADDTPSAASSTTVADLVPDPRNRRKRTERNLDMIAEALRTVGAARSIVIDERNEVLAGNGVIEAAQKIGMTKVQVVDADGDTIVAVRRTGLTAAQRRDLAMYDNRAAELAEWDVDVLKADIADGFTFEPWFEHRELERIVKIGGVSAPATNVEAAPSQFVIIVQLPTEAEQTAWLAKLMAEGLTCRAVVS